MAEQHYFYNTNQESKNALDLPMMGSSKVASHHPELPVQPESGPYNLLFEAIS